MPCNEIAPRCDTRQNANGMQLWSGKPILLGKIMEDEHNEIQERSAREIAERILALVAVVAHAQHQEWVADWTRQFGIHHYFSDSEQSFFNETAPGKQAIIDFSWRAEALVSLVFALQGLPDMPPLSAQFCVLNSDFIEEAMKNPNSFLISASKRDSDEIHEMEGFLYHQHWRIRDRQLGFNVGAGHALESGELPVDELNSSVVLERRYGLSWVVGFGEDWDNVPTDT